VIELKGVPSAAMQDALERLVCDGVIVLFQGFVLCFDGR
jgi:hypothetical protein